MDKWLRYSRVAFVAVFLALVRCIAEPLRLQYYAHTPLTVAAIQPYLVGAIVAAAGAFAMVLLSFWKLSKYIVIMGILVVAGLFIVKAAYHI